MVKKKIHLIDLSSCRLTLEKQNIISILRQSKYHFCNLPSSIMDSKNKVEAFPTMNFSVNTNFFLLVFIILENNKLLEVLQPSYSKEKKKKRETGVLKFSPCTRFEEGLDHKNLSYTIFLF